MLIRAICYTKPDIGSPAEARLEGFIEGSIRSLLRILEHRGIPVSPAARARITACTDFNLTEIWLDNVFDVTSAEELIRLDDV